MNVCLNGLPIEQGAWVRRGGTQHADLTRNGLPGRLIPFDFTRATPYKMEFTEGVLRFFDGPTVVKTNDAVAVSAISTATPAVVTTAAAHNWSTGNQIKFADLGVNSPLLQNRTLAITVIDTDEFSIADALTGDDIDGSTLGTFVSGTAERILELVVPYVGTSWQALRAVQADIPLPLGSTVGSMLLHGTYQPHLLKLESEPTDDEFAEFSVAAQAFKDGPYFDPVPGGTLATPSATLGIVTLTLSFNTYDATRAYSIDDYVVSSGVNYKSLTDANLNNTPASSPTHWVAVSAADAIGPNGFEGSDVGRLVRLYSEPPVWLTGTVYAAGARVAYGGTGPRYEGATYWKSLVGSNSGNQPGIDLTKWALDATGARWTWGKIVALSNIIDRALSGSTQIGDMANGGGLNAAFNGVFAQLATASAQKPYGGSSIVTPGEVILNPSFVGKNYSGASAQAVAGATVYPSSDFGLYFAVYTGGAGISITFTLNLRASNSNPVDWNDGSLLGTSGSITNRTSPINITSNDTVSTWNYVWIELVARAVFSGDGGGGQITMSLTNIIGQVSFFSPTGSGSSSGVDVQIIGDALFDTTPIRTWRLGLYSDTTGWPTCGCYHEGRLWLSGAVDNRIDASQPNDPFNFAPTEPNGTVTGANGISYVFNSKSLNPIFAMEPDDLGIVCCTQSGEWLVQATTLNAPLTPTTIQAHQVTHNGCADIEPRRTDLALAVVHRYKRKTLEYFADVFRGKFTAHNLSMFCPHLTAPGIAELAFQQELAPVIWHRMDDGSLIGITYKRDSLVSSQPANFMGAHRHTLGSGRTVESIAVGAAPGGLLDSLGLVTNHSDGNVRHVEIMTPYFAEGDALVDATQLDDAIVPSSYVAGGSSVTFNGLWAHNGKSVTVFAGGLDLGEYTVSDGVVTVPYGAGITATGPELFTSAFVAAFAGEMPALVGFTFTSQGQIVRPATPAESGARNGPALGKTRRTHKYAALLGNAVVGSVSFGTVLTGTLRPALFKTPGGTAYSIQTLFNGVYKDQVQDDYSLDSMLAWQVTRPYPLTVMAVEGMLSTQDE